MCFQRASSGLPGILQYYIYANYHWIVIGTTMGASINQCGYSGILVYSWLQLSSSVFWLCKQALDSHRKTTVLKHQPLYFQCSLSYGIPGNWQHMVCRSAVRVPACNPLCIQLSWRELFKGSWFYLNFNPNTQKLYHMYNNFIAGLLVKYTT